jgi:hypothetical protein
MWIFDSENLQISEIFNIKKIILKNTETLISSFQVKEEKVKDKNSIRTKIYWIRNIEV